MKLVTRAIIGLAAALSISTANAGIVWEFTVGPGQYGENKDSWEAYYDEITSTYDATNEVLTWTTDNSRDSSGALMEGFWLVVNDGPNPKTADVNELAIFYADFNSDTLSAYAYNGLNNSKSWKDPGILIGDYSAGLIESGSTQGFSIDVSAINSFTNPAIDPLNWKGAQFDSTIGIWFHPVWGLDSEIDPAGLLTKFKYSHSAWYDKANKSTFLVPEPSTIALLALALVGFFFSRKRKSE